jgi:hypothetical protein
MAKDTTANSYQMEVKRPLTSPSLYYLLTKFANFFANLETSIQPSIVDEF